MNTRTLLIIAGLALPIIALGALTMQGKKEAVRESVAPTAANAIKNAARQIEAEKARHRARLAEVEKMTDAQWPQDLEKNPHHAATRQQAIDYQKKAIALLDNMTPQQWIARQQQRQQQWYQQQKNQAPRPAQTVPKIPLPPVGR
ncbi:MAG: hypothetical protein KGI29_02755 [Pseudomonadota bacterium]|nr:hypothetical protein [Pseudomonadota bacterium]MDE3038612.1 hypothetical protein [Pseudomonadota bacterium]